jgi:hypothetical protein
MSTQLPSTTDPEFKPTTETFTTGNAPRTFDPFNTRDCPEMFDGKWQDSGDGLEHR